MVSDIKANRQAYIDWLRVGAMLLLIFYHTGRLFDDPNWHIKNAELNFGIEVFNRILDIWHMPLFFLLAGASVWFALEKRNSGQFSKERVLRILVPLIFGILIIVPPQVYLERVFDGDFTGSFWQWYPNTFVGIYSMNDASTGNFSWHHLWFLAYLFVFSLILLPLFAYFRRGKGNSKLNRFSEFLSKPGAIYLLAIPLIIINIFLRPIFGSGNQNLVADWANFLFYISVFFYGFLLVSDNRMLAAAQKQRVISWIAVLAITILLYLVEDDILVLSPSIQGPILLTLYALDCWVWILAIIGTGSLLLNSSNKVLKYASEAVLPVYILHQTLIIIFGFYVIQWNANVAVKYTVVSLSTLLAAIVIYELIKRTGVTRFLFGIKGTGKKTGKQSKAT